MNTRKKKKSPGNDFPRTLFLTREGQPNRWMCKLPLPSRSIIQGAFDMWESSMGESKEIFFELYRNDSYHSNAVWNAAPALHDEALKFINMVITSVNIQTVSMGQATFGDSYKYSIIMPHRFKVCDGKYFSITPTINMMLLETDMVAKCPAQYLKLPFRNIFIDCGIERDTSLRIHNSVSGEHIFEGAYVTEVFHPEKDREFFTKNCNQAWKNFGYQSDLILRSIEFMLCGSPVGKRDINDDAYFTFSIHVTDENESIDSIINKGIELFKKQNTHNRKHEVEDHLNAILHIVKTIILINTKNCELIEKNYKDDLLKKVRSQSIQYKKDALIEQRKYTHNTIHIELQEKEKKVYVMNESHVQSKCKTHWRRGHFRMLNANPPGRPFPRPTWIKPCIVNASENDSGEIKNKPYLIE